MFKRERVLPPDQEESDFFREASVKLQLPAPASWTVDRDRLVVVVLKGRGREPEFFNQMVWQYFSSDLNFIFTTRTLREQNVDSSVRAIDMQLENIRTRVNEEVLRNIREGVFETVSDSSFHHGREFRITMIDSKGDPV